MKIKFHENRYSIARIIGAIVILIVVFVKRETIDVLFTPPKIGFSVPRKNVFAKRLTKENITKDADLAMEINRFYLINKTPFVFYETSVSKRGNNVFCGIKTKVSIQKGTLADIKEASKKTISLTVGKKTPELWNIIQKIIPLSYEEDKIYACVPKNTSNINISNINPQNIFCQKISILSSESNISTKALEVIYLKRGNGPSISCKDTVNIDYEVMSSSYQLIFSNKIKNIVIGEGSSPIQIDHLLLDITRNSNLIIRLKNDSFQYASFYGNKPQINQQFETLQKLLNKKGELLLKIKVY